MMAVTIYHNLMGDDKLKQTASKYMLIQIGN